MMVLEPIFEADLQPEQHAYRAGVSALDAVKAVHRLIIPGTRLWSTRTCVATSMRFRTDH